MKRDDRRSRPEWEHAATRKVDTLSEAFAAELLRRGSVPDEPNDASAHERITERELPGDPEATGAHADRAALDAARLIVVGSDPALPIVSEPPASAALPAPTTASRWRLVVLLAILAIAAVAVAVVVSR